MSYQMSGNMQLCGTCEYWVGAREPSYFGNAVLLDNQSVKGKCFCLNGPFSRAERFSNSSTCGYYRKWLLIQR